MTRDSPALAFDVELAAGPRTMRRTALLHEAGTLVVFGPSGIGKTLVVRALAGLVRPLKGIITLAGRTVFASESKVWIGPQDRRVGYVPQQLALFPHLSVRDNVGFGVPRGRRSERVGTLLEILELEHLAHRFPATLSGGEQQRVAVARAIAPWPRTLLLDEPFSALDRDARLELRAWFRDHVRTLGLTVVFVTHDREEAVEMGDHLILLGRDQMVCEGAPSAVLRPAQNAAAAGPVVIGTNPAPRCS